MKILIVDDDPGVVAGIAAMLSMHEIESDGAEDGAEAERRIADEFFPVILADLRLRSDEEGLRLLDAVRRLSPRSRVASMTGYADAATEQLLRERGAHVVLRKPFLGDEVVPILRELLAAVEAAEESCATDDQLYTATAGTLHAICRRRFGFDSGDAEELVQETWLLFLQKRAAIRAPRAWLAGAAANLCRQRIERYARERERAAEMSDIGAPPPHDAVISVRQALAGLDERSRALCTMIGLEERSYEEVSAALGLPLGSVGPLYIRAKTRLRKDLA